MLFFFLLFYLFVATLMDTHFNSQYGEQFDIGIYRGIEFDITNYTFDNTTNKLVYSFLMKIEQDPEDDTDDLVISGNAEVILFEGENDGADDEKQVLLDIYNSNPQSQEKLGWDINEPDLSKWAGVTLDVNGKVIELNLINKVLKVLPTSIGYLSQLTFLDLRGNELTALPPDIGNLTQLIGVLWKNPQK